MRCRALILRKTKIKNNSQSVQLQSWTVFGIRCGFVGFCSDDELSIFLSLDFAFYLKVNNNSTSSKALSWLSENHYQFHIHSNIIGSLSALCYSLPLSDISAIWKWPRFCLQHHFKVWEHWKCQIPRLIHLWPMELEFKNIDGVLKWFVLC